MIKYKIGVRIVGLKPEMLLAFPIIEQCYANYAVPCVITSVNDSTHKFGSKHYDGKAVDLRTKNTSDNVAKLIVDDMRKLLGPLGFDVVLESDHIHVEYDPK